MKMKSLEKLYLVIVQLFYLIKVKSWSSIRLLLCSFTFDIRIIFKTDNNLFQKQYP